MLAFSFPVITVYKVGFKLPNHPAKPDFFFHLKPRSEISLKKFSGLLSIV
jgi:hypothetical protein